MLMQNFCTVRLKVRKCLDSVEKTKNQSVQVRLGSGLL